MLLLCGAIAFLLVFLFLAVLLAAAAFVSFVVLLSALLFVFVLFFLLLVTLGTVSLFLPLLLGLFGAWLDRRGWMVGCGFDG